MVATATKALEKPAFAALIAVVAAVAVVGKRLLGLAWIS